MADENLQAITTAKEKEMTMKKSTTFTYEAAEKKCPSCGEALLPLYRRGTDSTFCVREHGTTIPPWTWGAHELPVATKTAKTGRFTIEGETGFWRIPTHAHKELLHDGPEEGSVVALLCRYHSKVPTVVAFMPRKIRNIKSVVPDGGKEVRLCPRKHRRVCKG